MSACHPCHHHGCLGTHVPLRTHLQPHHWLGAGAAGSCPTPPAREAEAGRSCQQGAGPRQAAPWQGDAWLSRVPGQRLNARACPLQHRQMGARGCEEEGQGQVPHGLSTRQQCQLGTHSSHAARPKAPTSPMGCSESKQSGLVQWSHHAHPLASTRGSWETSGSQG